MTQRPTYLTISYSKYGYIWYGYFKVVCLVEGGMYKIKLLLSEGDAARGCFCNTHCLYTEGLLYMG